MKTGDPYIDGKLAAMHGKPYDPHKDPHFNRGYMDVMRPQRSRPPPPDAPTPAPTQAQEESRVAREWNSPESRAARERFYKSQIEAMNLATDRCRTKDEKAGFVRWVRRGFIAAVAAFVLIVAFANFGPFMSWLDDLSWQAEMRRQGTEQ